MKATIKSTTKKIGNTTKKVVKTTKKMGMGGGKMKKC